MASNHKAGRSGREFVRRRRRLAGGATADGDPRKIRSHPRDGSNSDGGQRREEMELRGCWVDSVASMYLICALFE